MAVQKSMASSSLAEVIDRILDKGIVIDAWARLSLVGIEFLSLEARVVAQIAIEGRRRRLRQRHDYNELLRN